MERFDTISGGNYGATSAAFPPPPPYSRTAPRAWSSGGWRTNVGLPRTSLKPSRFLNPRSFVALVTFFITLGLALSTIPFKHCDGPGDPQVRERIRGEWAKEVAAHEIQVADREVVKTRWAREDQQHAALLREWEHERVQHEQGLEERARREESQRLGLFWSQVEAHQCKTYGTREYTAVLMNQPAKLRWRVQACKATPLEVHGVSRYPKSCEERGQGVVIGTWEVDQHEPDCNTYWNWYKDKESYLYEYWAEGCTSNGSGKRRIEHYLENLPRGGDWREFCATTPAYFHGMKFSGAQECFQYNQGTYGHWEIDDNSC